MAPLMKQRDLTEIAARVSLLPPDRQVVVNAALSASCSDDQLARGRTSLRVAVTRLEDTLCESPWLAGDDYSLADIALFPMAMSLQALMPTAVTGSATPHLVRWLQTIRDREPVRAALSAARTPDPSHVFAPGPELARWG
jgi:glutathione S-transferase